ncbi:MFS transporter [Nocardioides speluncae]|uniref:MFS transporter n=1 Tax=Nocardioides speluncae TaxID=2670337 RepID=UPI001981F5B3|nr:MFS transporter [Nocardioides speluncae]
MLERLGFPSVGRHRKFVTAIGVDAVGSGVFMPVSMLYFLATTDLSLVQVGLAISIASALALPAGPLLGGVIDQLGAKRVLLAGNLLQGLGFAAYLISESFTSVLVWTLVVSVGRTAFWGSYGNIVTAISSPGEREMWFGFLGALRNVGFAVGGLLSGLAITIGTDAAYAGVVVLNAASYFLAFALLLAVPDTGSAATHTREPGSWATVLRDRQYGLLVVTQFGYSFAMMALNFAMPIYASETLDLAGWVIGAIFVINTVMIGFGQGLVVKRLTGVVRARALVTANLVFAASFLVMLGADLTAYAVAVVVVLAATVVYTMAELIGGPVYVALGAEAAPDHLRGRYLSLIQLTWGVASSIAPVTFAWLLARGATELWLALTAVSLLGALIAVVLAGCRTPPPASPTRPRSRCRSPDKPAGRDRSSRAVAAWHGDLRQI